MLTILRIKKHTFVGIYIKVYVTKILWHGLLKTHAVLYSVTFIGCVKHVLST